MSLFVGQTLAKIYLETGQVLTNTTSHKIIYQKPNNEKGEWTAVADGTKIYYEIASANDLNLSGTYKLQASYQAGGKIIYGEIAQLEVKQKL